MRKTHALMRRGGLGVGALLAAGGLVATVAGPASATTTTPKNHVIIASGAGVTYDLVNQLADLYNSSPGCNLLAPTGDTQPLDFSCPSASNTGKLAAGNTENPINDVVAQEPEIGSSNAIEQLENQGKHTTPTAPINFATSSRSASSKDLQGLNFVAYAKDGVSWFHFTSTKGKPTASAGVKSLTITQLTDIWEGKITNWKQVGGKNATIAVYGAQYGAGNKSTWDSALGIDTDAYILTKGSTYADSHIIPVDSDAQIFKNGDESRAIYYYSTGVFGLQCKSNTGCGGTKPPAKGYTAAIGEINGVKATKKTVLAGTFPVTRFLSTVYSNGSNSNIPVATQATLNFASEVGFLCKPNTSKGKPIVDPNTGHTYRYEINSAIKAQGFIPLPKQAHEGVVPHPAPLSKSSPYYAHDPHGTNPAGYCLVTDTDSNADA